MRELNGSPPYNALTHNRKKMNQSRIKRYLTCALMVFALLTSCSNGFIYEDEGDCDPRYRVRFRYDRNMKYADAFAAEVDHVTLNVVDSDGRIVYTCSESGNALKADGYEMVLDKALAPGSYRLQAWCGSGAAPGSGSFAVHDATALHELCCTLLPDPDGTRGAEVEGADGKHVRRSVRNLYHGLTSELLFPDSEGVHAFTVPLTKNTNSVKVMLQHLSGSEIDGNEFDFTITANNARMAHDNSIISTEKTVYHAWSIRNGSGTLAPGGELGGGTFDATVAEFTVGRLMAGEDVRLEAHRISDGKLIFSVNMVNLALLLKSENISSMDNQEFLDRQDDYNFIFFLDANYRWVTCQINILSWTRVWQNSEI